MRGAWFGFYALSLLGMHLFFVLFETAGILPYFRTVLYPFLLLVILLISLVGLFEKDRRKIPSLTALVLSSGMLVHWVVVLVMRLNS